MLTQIAALIRIDLGACVVEIVVFDKGGPLRNEKVSRASGHVPCQVGVISSTPSVDRGSTGHGIGDLDPGRLGVVNANPRAGIRLEPPSCRPNSQNDVKHKGARIEPSSPVALAIRKNRRTVRAGRERLIQIEISPTPEAIVKEVSLNGGTNHPIRGAKDVTQFDATIETDVIFWIHLEIRSEKMTSVSMVASNWVTS